MNVCGVTFGGYLTKILSFKTGNLLNNSKFHLLSEGTVWRLLLGSVVHRPFQKGQAVSGVDGFVHVRLGHRLFLGPLCITISLPNKARSGH